MPLVSWSRWPGVWFVLILIDHGKKKNRQMTAVTHFSLSRKSKISWRNFHFTEKVRVLDNILGFSDLMGGSWPLQQSHHRVHQSSWSLVKHFSCMYLNCVPLVSRFIHVRSLEMGCPLVTPWVAGSNSADGSSLIESFASASGFRRLFQVTLKKVGDPANRS